MVTFTRKHFNNHGCASYVYDLELMKKREAENGIKSTTEEYELDEENEDFSQKGEKNKRNITKHREGNGKNLGKMKLTKVIKPLIIKMKREF